jgi:hypothetical protein
MPGKINFSVAYVFEGYQVIAEDCLQLFEYEMVKDESVVNI